MTMFAYYYIGIGLGVLVVSYFQVSPNLHLELTLLRDLQAGDVYFPICHTF